MRGRDFYDVPLCCDIGITPAYAGKRPQTEPPQSRPQDHPRVCGEEVEPNINQNSTEGSPPRMRGRARRHSGKTRFCRITPAYAGKRTTRWASPPPAWDHPRVCGEEPGRSEHNQKEAGSPPRMRGRDQRVTASSTSSRITPAYAGKSAHTGC